jgi:hypothetical protein
MMIRHIAGDDGFFCERSRHHYDISGFRLSMGFSAQLDGILDG